jgi:3-oxoacyl-[acyl-carrier protein] reductase
MDITMNGRSAIVTGGSKGIGYGIATRFATSGADVAIVARTQASLDEAVNALKSKTNSKVVGVASDVSSADGVKKAYDGAMAAFGKVDIIVNNAGTSQTGPFENLTDEIMQKDLDLKFFAAIRLSRLVWPQMKERKRGRIINILNIGAKAPGAGSAPTSISRAAGMAFTKALAGEGAPHGILVNALLVGLIEADQHVQKAKKQGKPLEQYMAELSKAVPLGRFGTPEEFANMACLLASDAGSYITGTAINIDGGRSPVV